MASFNQILSNVGVNLNDTAQRRFTVVSLQSSCQRAYTDISILSRFLPKKVTLNWSVVSNKSYIDFVADYGISDFLAVIAIFNNVSRRWLHDNLLLKHFDLLRTNWETWISSPYWWAFAAFNKTAVCPKYSTGTGTFDLYYFATAPTIADFTTSPLIAADMQNLLEFYITSEQLESVNEFTKALAWWQQYYEQIDSYHDRVMNQAKADMRTLI